VHFLAKKKNLMWEGRKKGRKGGRKEGKTLGRED
jgi:hypothetical protein